MNYRYYENDNFEDFACGRVILGKAGMTNFPVRLTGEIFKRCLEYAERTAGLTVYDPCCGSGYMLTVAALLNPYAVGRIAGSDIDPEAVSLAKANLSLLTANGLMGRREQIEGMVKKYGKQSHIDALSSVDRFAGIIRGRTFEPEIICFATDATEPGSLAKAGFKSDVVITDVPYGRLVSWDNGTGNAVNVMLENLLPVLHGGSVVAVIADKSQKIRNDRYQRLEKFKVGKRQVEIIKPKGKNNS